MTEWVKISDMEKTRATAMRLDGVSPLSADDIPDTHTITVSERSISVDNSEIIQNNIKTDLIELVLDGEWYDCGSVYVTLGRSAGYDEPVQLEWEGTALTFPAQLGTEVGGIDVSVVGYGNDGEMRLVTKASSNTFRVVASGYVEGVPPTEENLDILAQIIQQGDAAEDAAQAANAAATSATSAASSANSAASSANSAASSANSAATKASSAAVDAQNAYDTLQPYMATIDSCANILHREVGPDTVVTADDAFPCKPVEMTVYGNTRQNLWAQKSKTQNGVTVTANDDGSISVNGTSTNSSLIVFNSIYTLKPGSQYTFSNDKAFDASADAGGPFIQCLDAGGEYTTIAYLNGTSARSVTFTVPSNAVMCITGVQVLNGKTVSGTYRVMLREATQEEIGQNTVLDDYWCPPGLNSVDELNVVTAGKNLIHYNDSLTPKTVLGITFMPNADGSITVNGTATGDADYYIVGKTFNNGVNNYLPRRQVVLSGSHSNVIIQLWGRTKQNTSTGSARANNVDVVIPADSGVFDAELIVIYLTVPNGITVDNAVIYPQLELGSTATDYEPPNVTTTPIDLQGHTLNALPDGTRDELHIDGGGNVVLEKRVGEVVLDGDENIEWTAGRIGIDNGAPGSATSTSIAKDGNAFCDKLPVAEVTSRVAIISYSSGWVDIRNDGVITDAASGRQFLQSNNTTYIYPLATPQTIDLGTITPPTMAAPNVTAYVADDTPAEMTLDYVRDVNIVHSRLEERVAALELASATS